MLGGGDRAEEAAEDGLSPESLGAPFGEKFRYHFYGPYSEQLADEVSWLVATGQVREIPRETPSGYREYVYQAESGGGAVGLGQRFRKLAQRLNDLDARMLELMATIQYLSLQGMDGHQAGLRARELKPAQAYAASEVEGAVAVLAELRATAA